MMQFFGLWTNTLVGLWYVLKRISFVSTKDSLCSDEQSEVLVSESEYYTIRCNILVLVLVFFLSQVSTKEK